LSDALVLEPLQLEHVSLLYPGLSDETLYRYFPQMPPRSEDELRGRVTRFLAGSGRPNEHWLKWVVRRGGQVVGQTEITIYPDASVYIAYFVFTPFHRQGIATRACLQTLDLIKHDFGVKRCSVMIDVNNTASLALMRRVGFQCDRIVMAADAYKGVISDEWWGSKGL
jgi:[ribosomal protein S5]-alanine N-acetyltransferase